MAVGDRGRACFRKSDGEWTELDTGVSINLRCATARSDGNFIIAGQGGTVLEFNGTTFQKHDFPTSTTLLGIVEADEKLIAVGGDYNVKAAGFLGRIFECSEGDWREIKTRHLLPRLRSVGYHNDVAVLCGDGGKAYALVDDKVREIETGSRLDLHEVSISQDGQIYFCGDFGTLLEQELRSDAPQIKPQQAQCESRWKRHTQNLTTSVLRGVWISPDGTVFAVGDRGAVLMSNPDEAWQSLPVPTSGGLHDVWGLAADNVYIVGNHGRILHYDGKSVSIVHETGLDVALLSITGFGPNNIFVVGDDGYALHFDGAIWSKMHTGTRMELFDVWGFDSNHVLAVGGAGHVLRWNGDNWKTFQAGTEQELFGVWGNSLENIKIVGLSGLTTGFDGKGWRKEHSGVRSDLHAITGSNSSEIVAVGSVGAIVCYKNGEWRPEDSGVSEGLRAVYGNGERTLAVGDNGMILEREHTD